MILWDMLGQLSRDPFSEITSGHLWKDLGEFFMRSLGAVCAMEESLITSHPDNILGGQTSFADSQCQQQACVRECICTRWGFTGAHPGSGAVPGRGNPT